MRLVKPTLDSRAPHGVPTRPIFQADIPRLRNQGVVASDGRGRYRIVNRAVLEALAEP